MVIEFLTEGDERALKIGGGNDCCPSWACYNTIDWELKEQTLILNCSVGWEVQDQGANNRKSHDFASATCYWFRCSPRSAQAHGAGTQISPLDGQLLMSHCNKSI